MCTPAFDWHRRVMINFIIWICYSPTPVHTGSLPTSECRLQRLFRKEHLYREPWCCDWENQSPAWHRRGRCGQIRRQKLLKYPQIQPRLVWPTFEDYLPVLPLTNDKFRQPPGGTHHQQCLWSGSHHRHCLRPIPWGHFLFYNNQRERQPRKFVTIGELRFW